MITGLEWILLILVLPIVLFLSVLFLIIRALTKKTAPQPKPPVKDIIREKEIIKEVVMVPCSYCGGLMPQTATFCPNCGARRKA